MSYRWGIGQTMSTARQGRTVPPGESMPGRPTTVQDFLTQDGSALRGEYAHLALICSDKTDPELPAETRQLLSEMAPEATCRLFTDPSAREQFESVPSILWDYNAETGEQMTPFGPGDCVGEPRQYHVDWYGYCFDSPYGDPRCAYYLHPATQGQIKTTCPGLVEEGIAAGESKRLWNIALWAGILGTGAAIFYYTAKGGKR